MKFLKEERNQVFGDIKFQDEVLLSFDFLVIKVYFFYCLVSLKIF